MSYFGNARVVSALPDQDASAACAAPEQSFDARQHHNVPYEIPLLPSKIFSLNEEAFLAIIDVLVQPELPKENYTAACNLALASAYRLEN